MTEIDWAIYGLEKVMKHGMNRPLTKPDLKTILGAIEILRIYQEDLRNMGWTPKYEEEEKHADVQQKEANI